MKRLAILLILCCILLCSCDKRQPKYERAIINNFGYSQSVTVRKVTFGEKMVYITDKDGYEYAVSYENVILYKRGEKNEQN